MVMTGQKMQMALFYQQKKHDYRKHHYQKKSSTITDINHYYQHHHYYQHEFPILFPAKTQLRLRDFTKEAMGAAFRKDAFKLGSAVTRWPFENHDWRILRDTPHDDWKPPGCEKIHGFFGSWSHF